MTHDAQRTPISLLQELCLANETTAEYSFVSAVGQSHAPTFTFQVQVNDIIMRADGASKQKAKHAAAKMCLLRLLTEVENFNNGFEFEGQTVTVHNLNDVMREPTYTAEEDLIGNPVGALQELCMKMKWSPPYYETQNVSGPPHDRNFSLSCTVEDYYPHLGNAKTKKVAKRYAADNMLEYFSGKSVIESDDGLSNFLADWNSSKSNLLECLEEIDLLNVELDCSRQLHRLTSEKNWDLLFDLIYMPIEHRGLNGNYYYFIQVMSSPVVTFIHSADTKEKAKNEAARQAINFFKHKLKSYLSDL